MFLLVYLKSQYLDLYYLFYILMILLRILSLFAEGTSFGYSNRAELQIKNVMDHDLKELLEWSKK